MKNLDAIYCAARELPCADRPDFLAQACAGDDGLQKRVQQSNTETVTEKQCETVYDTREKTVGYDVRYRVGGAEQTVRMTTDPGVGAQLPLRNGKLIA